MPVQLVHFKASTGNVGDDFSEWLFTRCLGSNLSEQADTLLFGVGSILDQKFDNAFSNADVKRRLVFGSGARSATTLPDIAKESWRIYCVRGPLTASALDLPAQKAVADPAILAPRLHPAIPETSGPIGIVPYFTASLPIWTQIAHRLGWTVISPHLGVEDFIDTLNRCSRVFCESMHGAIFADAYRIPWRPLSGTGANSEGPTHAFKWTDWSSAMGIGFDSIKTPAISSFSKTGLVASCKQQVKVAWLARVLGKAAREDRFQLSRDTVLASRQEQLLTLMDELCHDLRNNLA